MPTVLECFQVAEPILTPNGASYQSSADNGSTVTTQITNGPPQGACTVLLMDHSFGNSYGAPFVGKENTVTACLQEYWATCLTSFMQAHIHPPTANSIV
jgi:hypothetical protein